MQQHVRTLVGVMLQTSRICGKRRALLQHHRQLLIDEPRVSSAWLHSFEAVLLFNMQHCGLKAQQGFRVPRMLPARRG